MLVGSAPTTEKEKAQKLLLNDGVCVRMKDNYAHCEKWKKSLQNNREEPYYDYSNFLVLREYARKGADLCLEWDLTEVDINQQFEPGWKNLYRTQKNEAHENYISKQNSILEEMKDARKRLREIYEECRRKHRCLKTIYEFGLLCQHSRDYALSAHLMTEYTDLASTLDTRTPITPQAYLLTSESLLSALGYDKAIELLTKAIQKYPDRKELYEQRIVAYLELGKYSEATQDFIAHDFTKDLLPDPNKAELATALLKGAASGTLEGIREFPLSLLHSLRGAGQMVWTTVCHPIAVPAAIIEGFEEAVTLLRDGEMLKVVEKVSPELHHILNTWDTTSPSERWANLGHYCGKNGIEIFATFESVKLIKIAHTIRSKNALCNVKTLTVSRGSTIIETSEAFATKRKSFFEKSKISEPKQNKHRENSPQWRFLSEKDKAKKSILTHSDPEGLLKKHAGKGSPVYEPTGKHPWEIGYKENVNFKEEIGIWKNEYGTKSGRTTWGRIYYDSRGGAHIVPIEPKE